MLIRSLVAFYNLFICQLSCEDPSVQFIEQFHKFLLKSNMFYFFLITSYIDKIL